MRVRDFASELTKIEGGAVRQPVAQISEQLKIANMMLGGGLYALIKGTDDKVVRANIKNAKK